jgi:hypothetical protein
MPRAYSDTGATGSDRSSCPTGPQYHNFALRHRTLSLHCRQLGAQRRMWQPLLTVLPVLSLARCGLAARLASFCALRPDILLDRRNVIKSRRAETLEIELCDEPGQRQFPGLRFVVIELAQFRWSNGEPGELSPAARNSLTTLPHQAVVLRM